LGLDRNILNTHIQTSTHPDIQYKDPVKGCHLFLLATMAGESEELNLSVEDATELALEILYNRR